MTANRNDGLAGLAAGLAVVVALNVAFAAAYVGLDRPAPDVTPPATVPETKPATDRVIPPPTGRTPPTKPADGPLTAGVADARVGTGVGVNALAVFRVTLSRPAESPVTVDYGTEDGTAKANLDYSPSAGRLTIPAGERSADIDVRLLPRREGAPARHFTLRLTAVSAGTLAADAARAELTAVEGPTPPPPTKPVPPPTKPTPTRPATRPSPPEADWTKGDVLVLVVPTPAVMPGSTTWDRGRARGQLNRQLAAVKEGLKGRLLLGDVLAVWKDGGPPVPWRPDEAAGRTPFGGQRSADATAALAAAVDAVETVRKKRAGREFRTVLVWASESEPGEVPSAVPAGVWVCWYGRDEASDALKGKFAGVSQYRDDEIGQTADDIAARAGRAKGGE